MAPAGMVTTHEVTMRPTTLRLMACTPLAMPTPSTAPISVCVVDIGMPVPEATTMVIRKDDPLEKVGNVAVLDGKTQIVAGPESGPEIVESAGKLQLNIGLGLLIISSKTLHF